jgi:Rieske Fe-S protein
MIRFRRPSTEPLWREEFSIHRAEEQYVSRRQFGKFLVLTSLGMFVGQLWIVARSVLRRAAGAPTFPEMVVARLSELPAGGGVRMFSYPTPSDPCILVRTGEGEWAAFSQKCTHLSCAVFYAQRHDRLECPCHEGYFSARDGRVLQGPPQRPLPRIVLERRGDALVATAVELAPGAHT